MRDVEQVLLQVVVLAVDDNPEDQSTLAVLLGGLGARTVLKASTGLEALTLMKSLPRPVDMIVADVRMPDGNGLQLLQAVRAGAVKGLRANATFVLATAYPEIGIIQTAASLDANGFVPKPLKREKLEAVILKARRTIFPPNFARHSTIYVPDTF
jgi:CheY-like chemotaxis protein